MAIRGAARLDKKPVRRCLFGSPDHEKVRKDLDRALAEMDRSSKSTLKSKWGFDVDSETGVPEGRYEYNQVKESEYVPCFYRKVYTTKTKRFIDSDSLDSVSASTARDLTASSAITTTATTSTQAGNGLANSQNTRTILTGVRRLDFKENCVNSASSSTSSSRSPRMSVRMLQSKMPDHYQTRKRRNGNLDLESTFHRGKSPRM